MPIPGPAKPGQIHLWTPGCLAALRSTYLAERANVLCRFRNHKSLLLAVFACALGTVFQFCGFSERRNFMCEQNKSVYGFDFFFFRLREKRVCPGYLQLQLHTYTHPKSVFTSVGLNRGACCLECPESRQNSGTVHWTPRKGTNFRSVSRVHLDTV